MRLAGSTSWRSLAASAASLIMSMLAARTANGVRS